MLGWFSAREATELGVALADQYATGAATAEVVRGRKSVRKDAAKVLEELLQKADSEIRKLRLNFYKKAKLANTFKWRLLEKGIERDVADEITQTLVMHVSLGRMRSAPADSAASAPAPAVKGAAVRNLFELGSRCVLRGEYSEAIVHLEAAIVSRPRHAEALNNLGVAYFRLGRHEEAFGCFTRAIAVKSDYADAHANLGNLYRATGRVDRAENSLRRALKLRPADEAARNGLGSLLLMLGQVREAKGHFEKVLRARPRSAEAVLGLGQAAALEGERELAESLYRRALELEPDMPGALASIAGLRKMTSADRAWLEQVERVADSATDPLDEANLRFAAGKYYDDVKEFDAAFTSYRRANELIKSSAPPYRRDAHSTFIDDLIRVYSPEVVSRLGSGVSASTLPVFVIGMPRSGTSLVEQIIASHPAAYGAGELSFWAGAVASHEESVRQGALEEPSRKKMADEYLHLLARVGPGAQRVVDKAPVNGEYLGLIHSVFPKARFIYTSRNPVDTCLSCYFQHFSAALSFTTDLDDLAHYYREHRRIMAHWRAVLPADTLLEVPYEQLIADPGSWTRKIVSFVGLDWDERCLEFHRTRRTVATASAWQVRQRIYSSSVERWRNYSKHIGPLRELEQLA